MSQESSPNEHKKIRILNADIYELIAYMHIFINVPKEITTLVYQAHKTKYRLTPFMNPGDHDLIIILRNRCEQLKMNVNREILYQSSEYFKVELTKFAKANTISVMVMNVYIAHDVIASLYNQKKIGENTRNGNIC
jgi:hypothetical protein